MKKADVIAFFGSDTKAAEAIGISQPAISQWGEDVPMSRRKNVELAIDAEQARRIAEEKKREQRERRKAKRAAQA